MVKPLDKPLSISPPDRRRHTVDAPRINEEPGQPRYSLRQYELVIRRNSQSITFPRVEDRCFLSCAEQITRIQFKRSMRVGGFWRLCDRFFLRLRLRGLLHSEKTSNKRRVGVNSACHSLEYFYLCN